MPPILGMPGVKDDRAATSRKVLIGGPAVYLPGGRQIDGSESRDPLHTGYIDTLRAGMLIGRKTATQRYAPSIIGVTNLAYADGQTVIQCSLATATEVVRRIGATGDLVLTGPAVAGGNLQCHTIAYTDVTYAGAASEITIPDQQTAFVAGAFIGATDGSAVPVGILGAQYGTRVTDPDGNDIDVPMPFLYVGGMVDTGLIVNYPTELSLIKHIKDQLNHVGVGWLFSDDFGGTTASERILDGPADEHWYGLYTIVETAAANSLELDIVDNAVYTTGLSYGMLIRHRNLGEKDGGVTSRTHGLGIRASLESPCHYRGILVRVAYTAGDFADRTICGIEIDMKEYGATDYLTGIWIHRNNTTKGTNIDSFVLFALEGAAVCKTLFYCQGIALPDFFLTLPMEARDMWTADTPSGSNTDYYLKVSLGDDGREYKILMQSEA